MTTLNAKANNAYHELIAEYEREHPDGVWLGFDHQRDAFETGWEAGHEAAQSGLAAQMGELSDALLIVDGYDVMEGDEVPERELWTVVNAARKVLEAAPQPVVDREAVRAVIRTHISVNFGTFNGVIDACTDAVLALLNGTAK